MISFELKYVGNNNNNPALVASRLDWIVLDYKWDTGLEQYSDGLVIRLLAHQRTLIMCVTAAGSTILR